jgi:hypothetical protein
MFIGRCQACAICVRIAHHELIFSRDLAADYQKILEVIGWMCADTRDWTAHHSEVLAVLADRP